MSEETTEVVENSESTTEESGTLLNVNLEQQEEQSPEDSAVPHMASDVEQPVESDIEWGDRPEWMPEQFWDEKDGPDLEGLSKSYQELRSKMSAGKHKAPKDGKYDVRTLIDQGVAEDDDLLTSFSSFAAENGMSQDQFDTIVGMYMDHAGAMMESNDVDMQKEMDKLGRNADKVLQSTSQWLTKLGTSGVLAAEEVDAIAGAATSADFVKALNKIRDSYGERTIPSTDIQETGGTTKADLDAMVADPRYGKDMHFTQSVERKFMEFFGEA